MNTNTTERQTRWGRSRVLGGGTGRLIAVSLVLGAALASAVGGIYIAVGHPSRPWVALAIFVVVMLPVSTALAWVVLVDRSTITGASKNAEENVEPAGAGRVLRAVPASSKRHPGFAPLREHRVVHFRLCRELQYMDPVVT